MLKWFVEKLAAAGNWLLGVAKDAKELDEKVQSIISGVYWRGVAIGAGVGFVAGFILAKVV